LSTQAWHPCLGIAGFDDIGWQQFYDLLREQRPKQLKSLAMTFSEELSPIVMRAVNALIIIVHGFCLDIRNTNVLWLRCSGTGSGIWNLAQPHVLVSKHHDWI
jgi:hypothetical protein